MGCTSLLVLAYSFLRMPFGHPAGRAQRPGSARDGLTVMTSRGDGAKPTAFWRAVLCLAMGDTI
jgi:hypothetical protein